MQNKEASSVPPKE